MEPHYYCSEARYTPTTFENGYQPTKVTHPYPGQYCIDKTTMGFSICRGGPLLFDGPFEMDHFKRRMNHTGEEEKYKIELAINRDSLLGACLQAHTATVPLYTMLDTGDHVYPKGSVVIHCTFALSREQIQSPPLSYKLDQDDLYLEPISGIGHISIEDLKGTASQYIDYIKMVMEGIVYPPFYRALIPKFEFIYLFHSPDGLTTLDCSFEPASTKPLLEKTTLETIDDQIGIMESTWQEPPSKRAKKA